MASQGSIAVPVNIDPIVSIETLHLNDGDVLILRCADRLTQDIIDHLGRKVGGIGRAIGKRVAVIVLDGTVDLEHLTADEARRLRDRLGRDDAGEGGGAG